MESSTTARLAVTVLGWTLLMAAIIILARLLSPSFGALMTALLIFLTLIGLVVFSVMWMRGRVSSLSNQDTSSEALKRNRLAAALRELSNEELIRLRERVTEGDIDEEQLARLMVLDESDASKVKYS